MRRAATASWWRSGRTRRPGPTRSPRPISPGPRRAAPDGGRGGGDRRAAAPGPASHLRTILNLAPALPLDADTLRLAGPPRRQRGRGGGDRAARLGAAAAGGASLRAVLGIDVVRTPRRGLSEAATRDGAWHVRPGRSSASVDTAAGEAGVRAFVGVLAARSRIAARRAPRGDGRARARGAAGLACAPGQPGEPAVARGDRPGARGLIDRAGDLRGRQGRQGKRSRQERGGCLRLSAVRPDPRPGRRDGKPCIAAGRPAPAPLIRR